MDLLNKNYRKMVIQEIESWENKARKAQSFRANEIYNDRIHQYVVEYLMTQFSKTTVKEMPVISSVNISKQVIDQESQLYQVGVERFLSNLSKDQVKVIEDIYQDGQFDTKLDLLQKMFRYLKQALIQVILIDGKIELRVLKPHQWDAIPDEKNPEKHKAIILSTFDRSLYVQNYESFTPTGATQTSMPTIPVNTSNKEIGDQSDYKSKLRRYVWWSDQYNFITDENGSYVVDQEAYDILSEDLLQNEIGILPFVEVAESKDCEYWVRQGNTLAEFTVQYNATLSDAGQVVRNQGWAQAYMKGPKDLLPENIQVGPNFILRLPIDKNNPVETEFGYANASPDLQGTLSYVERIFNDFITSRGLTKKSFTGEASYSSGVERLISMVEKYENSARDIPQFERVEKYIFNIVLSWLETYSATDILKDEYKVTAIPQDASISVKFKRPEMIMTDTERLDILQKEIDMGLASKVDYLQGKLNTDRESAEIEIQRIDGDNKKQTVAVLNSMMSEEQEAEEQEEDDMEESDAENT